MGTSLDIAKEMFEALGFKVVTVPSPTPEQQAIWARIDAEVRGMSDDELRAAWDNPDLMDSPETMYGCDDIHAELNRRGLGRYCAV